MVNYAKKIYRGIKYLLLQRHFFFITSPFRVFPDFIIIGVKRCGTTSLYEQLSEHPCISKSSHDNIGFFNNNFELGFNWYKSHFPSKWTRKKIIKHFGKFMTYDVTSSYIQSHQTAENIFKTLPKIKLLIILRNPTNRAYSEYNQRVIDEGEEKSFDELIEQEFNEIKNKKQKGEKLFPLTKNSLIKKGIYVEQILPWLEIFPKDQILIISTEDFGNKTIETYNEIFRFLNLSEYDIRDKKRFRKVEYSKMNNTVKIKLDEFFREYNEQLYQTIGKRYDWC